MLKHVKVPPQFIPPFSQAEGLAQSFFSTIKRQPEQGTMHIGDDRYVFMRAESLYLSWFEALAQSFGEEAAGEFIYNTAREIGRSDSAAFASRMQLSDPLDKLAAGPVCFAQAGWAFVEILDDSTPAPNDTYFIHYYHPNTFESEVTQKRGKNLTWCGCLYSAGYSAGWCSAAFNMEIHGRELRCISKGDTHCEFIMAPSDKLDAREEQVRAGWKK